MEKGNQMFDRGMEALGGEKPNPKKAATFFIKAWKIYSSLREWDKVYESIDKITECYHTNLRKPALALQYLENKHDLKAKFKDYEGAVMAGIEIARMYAEYPGGRDEALSFYQRAWKENVKYAVGGEINELIPNEVAELLKSMGKSEEFIEKYLAGNFN